MIWKREQRWWGQLGQAAAETATLVLAAAAKGGGSRLALLPRFRGAHDPAARGKWKRLPVISNTRENLRSGAGGLRTSLQSWA